MADYDYSQYKPKDRKALEKLNYKYALKREKADIRDSYSYSSVFNGYSPYTQPCNPYMGTPQSDPMSGMMDMMNQMIPMIMMYKMMTGSDMFSKSSGSKSNSLQYDENGWALSEQGKNNDGDKVIKETYKNRDGRKKEIEYGDDGGTTSILTAKNGTTYTTKADANDNLTSKEIKGAGCCKIGGTKYGQMTLDKFDDGRATQITVGNQIFTYNATEKCYMKDKVKYKFNSDNYTLTEKTD